MKKRWLILALIAVLVIGVQAIPAHVIANKTDYAANIGKQATFNAALGRFTVVSDPVEVTADTLSAPENVISREEIPDGLVVKILDCVRDNSAGIWWYRIEAAVGHTLPDAFPETPWIYQNNADYSGEDALILMDVVAAPETNSDPSKFVDSLTGVKVLSDELPQGATLQVESVDAAPALADFGADYNVVTSLDISVKTKNEKEWQPETTVTVQMPVAAQPGTTVGLLHTHEGKTSFLGVTEVSKNGTIAFETNGFSEFVAFTVDFHYKGIDFSIPGESAISLADLFAGMSIDEDASLVASVYFSNPELVAVSRDENGWTLQSVVPFETEETLVVVYEDGRTIVIDVTDEVGGKEDDGDGGTTKRYYLLGSGPNWAYSNRGVVMWYNNATLTNGMQDIDINMTFPDGTTVSDTGENFFLNPTHVYLKVRSDGRYWFKLTGSNKVDITDPGDDFYSYYVAAQTKWGQSRYINFEARDTAISLPNAQALCSVAVAPKTSMTEENRTVEIYLNGSKIDSRTVAFPVRDSNLHTGYYFTDYSKTGSADIYVTFNNSSAYRFAGVSVNQSSKTYRLDFYNNYTVTYASNGGNGSMSNQGFVYGTAQNLYANAFTHNGFTVTYNANGGSVSPASATTTTAFSHWLGSNGVTYSNQQSVNNLTTTPGGVITMTAQWKSTTSVTLPNPTKTGYTFGGWSDGTKTYAAGTTYTPTKNITLTAIWNPVAYKVTLDKQGGSGGTDAYWYKYNTVSNGVYYYTDAGCTTALNNYTVTKPTRAGYAFGGYYTAKNGGGTQYVDANGVCVNNLYSAVAANSTLYAKWTPITYTATFDPAGGSLSTTTGAFTVEGELVLPTPTRTGYTYVWKVTNATGNWTNGAEYTGSSVGTGKYGDVTLTAVWTPINYAITYDLAGGSLPSGKTNPATYTVETNTFTLNNPVRDGYTFLGWTGSNGTTAQASVSVAKGNVGERNYTANWKANNYTLSFDYNGGANSANGTTSSQQTATYDSSNYCDVSWLNPAREGYLFAGWYTAAEGGTQVYDADGHAVPGAYWNSANKWIGTADLSMFAHWTPITYTVTFNGNGGTGMEDQTQTYEYGTEYTLPQAGCTRVIKVTYQAQGGTEPNRTDELEATFLGWKVNNTGDLIADQATVSNLTSENGAQVVLYAQWAFKSVTLPATQWVGHTFKGWYDAAEGGTAIGMADSVFTPTQDTVLYAQWAVVSYTITYQYNDGVSTDSIEEYNPDQAVTLYRTPARPGYRFDGWKLANDEGSWTAGIYAAGKAMGTGNYGNPVFVAQWSQQYRYVLKFDANGGTNAPATIIGDWQDNDTYSFTWSTVPTRANYRFVGWGESPDATDNVAGEGKNTYSVSGVATQTVEKTLYAIWELESGHMELKYTGTGRPAVVTITGQGLTITTVVATDTVISNLPAGEYTVTVSSAYASDEAAVSDPHPEVRPGETTSIGITTTERELNWFFGFCRCINRFLRLSR